MYPSMQRLTWISLVALLLMWLATVAQEPGGLSTVAAEMAFVEERIGQQLAQIEQPVVFERRDSGSEVYVNGVLCERDTETGKATHCQSLMPPEMFGY